jgi:hypothetical protein
VVEIDGFQGHKNYRSIRKDQFRLSEIKNLIAGEVKCFRFSFWQLKNFDEMVPYIKKEMGLD